jgi:integrase
MDLCYNSNIKISGARNRAFFLPRCRFALAAVAAVRAARCGCVRPASVGVPFRLRGCFGAYFRRKESYLNKAKTITNEHAAAIMGKLAREERLIFCIAVETGFRISDILHLKADIKQTITIVERKTKKFRSATLSSELYAELLKYSPLYYPERYLFKSRTDVLKPYNRMTYHRKLKRAAEALQIDFSAHSMRKLYALNIFQRTGSLEAVQQAMNHKYISTTATYLGIDINQLIKNALS